MTEILESNVRPILTPNAASAPFFDGAAAGRLMLRRCRACGTWHAPQALFCMECLSAEIEWTPASGRGRVHSFTIIHRGQIEGLETPYNVAIVETEEGPRIVSQLLGIAPDRIVVGMSVSAVFRRLSSGMVLPYFAAE